MSAGHGFGSLEPKDIESFLIGLLSRPTLLQMFRQKWALEKPHLKTHKSECYIRYLFGFWL